MRVEYSPPYDSSKAKELAVFVHGWRMTDWDYHSFSRTMFKRFYWQGFQGRFAALRWPTRSQDTDPSAVFGLIPPDFLTYNRSEHISFKSGTGAAAYFNDLRSRFPDYTISVCSHSQGGILMMEALAELAASSESPIDHYVMMETAVPARCYDPAVTNLPALVNIEQSIPTPNTYLNYASTITNALRGGKVINFFNPVDFALASGLNGTGLGSWENNQELLKPLVFFGYLYIATNQTAYVISNQFTGAFGITNLQNRIVTDPLELMPFVARPRSKAVGAQAGVGNVVNGPEYNLQSQLGFTAATYDHSGQFNRNIQTPQVQGFYFNLLRALTEGEL
jgi:pimeloyl-ACP methyl ester carboxylesterase